MPEIDISAVLESLEKEEGFRSHVYQDSKGYWTIGIGRLVDSRRPSRGLTREEARYLLKNDVNDLMAALDRRIAWWREMTSNRQRAILEMAFQLGPDGLLRFKKMIRALEIGNYERAALEALDSRWAEKETPARAQRMAALIREG